MLRQIIFFFLFIMVILEMDAQSAFTQHTGARSIGLGNMVTMIDDASAAIGNPAILPQFGISGVQVSAGQRFNLSDLKELQLSGGIQVGKNGSAFGSIQYFGFDTYTEQKFGIGYAMNISEKAAASIQLNAYQFRIDEYGSAFKPGFQIGFFTQAFDEISFSATVENPIKLSEDLNTNVDVPTIIRVGTKYSPSEKVTTFFEVEKDVNYEPSFKFGVEYLPIENIALRFGAKTEPATVHMGVGYFINENFSIDAGVGYHTLLGLTPGVGISFFTKNKK